MTTRPDPVAAADDEARAQARAMLQSASHAALSWLEADGTPGISRIAFGLDPEGVPLTLISGLAPHSPALKARAACAVMVGEVGAKGDPLTHPRLMVRARASFIDGEDPAREALRAHWLKGHPKAALYVDFPDFSFVRLELLGGLLNGGFGKAFRFTAEDLRG